MEVKRLRLRLIKGVSSEGEIAYSEPYELTEQMDIKLLQQLLKGKKYCPGFILEKSFFENNNYHNEYGENEFHPIFEVVYAVDYANSFKFLNDVFCKTEYHIVKDSVLEVSNYLKEVLINSKYGINDTLEYVDERLGESQKIKTLRNNIKNGEFSK